MSGFSNPFLKRIVFMGTPEFAASYLEPLLQEGVPIVGVLTQEDSVSARGKRKVPPPVKRSAIQYGIPVFQPRQINQGDGFEELSRLQPDMILLIAFGRLLKQRVLDLPRFGIFNLHPSLLPRYRGAAPIQRCLLNGDRETGVCLMRMSLALDAGPVVKRVTLPVSADETYSGLARIMKERALPMLLGFLRHFDPATTVYTEQDPCQEIGYATKIEKEELWVRWEESSDKVHNQIRAFDADPLSRTVFKGAALKLAGSRLLPSTEAERSIDKEFPELKPGAIVNVSKQGIRVLCGKGSVIVGQVQFPGKTLISAYQAAQGRLLSSGDYFEAPV